MSATYFFLFKLTGFTWKYLDLSSLILDRKCEILRGWSDIVLCKLKTCILGFKTEIFCTIYIHVSFFSSGTTVTSEKVQLIFF